MLQSVAKVCRKTVSLCAVALIGGLVQNKRCMLFILSIGR